MNPIRLLRADEIDCRVAQIRNTGPNAGLQLLLYKDARCDMAILDETFGPMNWQRRHTRDNANCIVSIYDAEKKQWIEKEDTGTESNTEAEKGLASDSFKRACVNVGIGRELYTSPFIWVNAANCEIKEKNGRVACYDRFEVSEIGYNDCREINRLVIINTKTKNVVFEFGKASPEPCKGRSRGSENSVDSSAAKSTKSGDRAVSGRDSASSQQMATEDQKKYIRENANDADYEALMVEHGANLENLTANQAGAAILMIDEHNKPKPPKCERCDKIITGIALPDGTLMSASELIGKSKLNYNGIYCYECMCELKKARKAG